MKDNDFSIIENRYLQKFPKINKDNFLSGDLSRDLNNYLEDHFPFRNNFISIKSYFEILMGRSDNNGVYIGKNNYLFEIFDTIDWENTKRNINLINSFSQNKNVSIMIIPTSLEILSHLTPKFSPKVNQVSYLNFIKQNLNQNIKFINTLDILKTKNNEYIYYKTDHHYTTLGAYYCYIKFCENISLDYLSLDKFKVEEVSNDFLGSLYSKVNLNKNQTDSIYIFTPLNNPYVKVDYGNKFSNSLYEFSHLSNTRSQYNIFLDNNHPLIKITSSVKNGKNITIIKDSFANSFIPFLVNHFEEIHVIDLRFYNSNITNYINENNLNNILFLYNTKNFSEDNNLIFIKRKEN